GKGPVQAASQAAVNSCGGGDRLSGVIRVGIAVHTRKCSEGWYGGQLRKITFHWPQAQGNRFPNQRQCTESISTHLSPAFEKEKRYARGEYRWQSCPRSKCRPVASLPAHCAMRLRVPVQRSTRGSECSSYE